MKHNESREKREGDGRGSVAESAKRARTHGERETSAKSATVVDSERENRMRIRGRSRECRGRRLSARTNERETLGVNSTLVYLEYSVYYIEGWPGGRTNNEKQGLSRRTGTTRCRAQRRRTNPVRTIVRAFGAAIMPNLP